MRRIVKGFNIVMSLLLVLIAIGVGFIAFPQFGNQALIVRSGSMAPAIHAGSIVVVSAKQNSPVYKTDDIIAFRSEKNSKTIITHRVVGVEPLKGGDVSYKTKGDANEEADGWIVNQKNVLGRVYFTIPFFGKILAFAKTDLGFPLLIIFPAVFVIIIEALNIVREIRKRRKFFLNEPPFGFKTFDIKKKNRYNWVGFKVLIPLVALGLIIPGSSAFFNDSETSTSNFFQAATVFPESSPSATLGIVINEVSPTGTNSAEWFEIYNASSSAINVSGWKVTDNNSTDTFPSTTPISSGGFAVVVGNSFSGSVPGSATTITLLSAIGGGLALGGDRLFLETGSSNEIDKVSWGSDATFFSLPSIGTSQSLSRQPNGLDTNSATDWQIDLSPSIGVSN